MQKKPKNVQRNRDRSSPHHSTTPPLHHSDSPLHSNSSFWEERYQSGDMPWEKGAPSPGLVEFLAAHPKLPRGTVCVPGCGTGHDVRAWAGAGFDVFGYDIAPSAIRLAAERTREAGLSAQFQLGDFLADPPPLRFDWIFEHTLFCAIQPNQRNDYVRAVLDCLNPNALYLTVNYLFPALQRPTFA